MVLSLPYMLYFSASSSLSNFAPAEKITIAMSDLYRTMESNQTIPPLVLLQVLHQAFPRFADKVEGHYMQQVNYSYCYNHLDSLKIIFIFIRA